MEPLSHGGVRLGMGPLSWWGEIRDGASLMVG